MAITTHVLPMGGGGFHGPVGGPSPLMLYFLGLTGKKHPKVCYLPTAQGDKTDGINQFLHVFSRFGAHPNFLSLFSLPTTDLEDWLMDFDAIFVGGGNTKTMIGVWKEYGVDKLLHQAWQRGIVISGGSAGANCWYEDNQSDTYPNRFDPLPGLGWLPGSCCPHYGDAKGWRPSYHTLVKEGRLRPGFGISERALIHYVNGKFHEVLIEFPEAGVYKVEKGPDGAIVESKLPARLLTQPVPSPI